MTTRTHSTLLANPGRFPVSLRVHSEAADELGRPDCVLGMSFPVFGQSTLDAVPTQNAEPSISGKGWKFQRVAT